MDYLQLMSAVFTLTLVMDPLGNVPLFIAALKNVPEERKRKIISRELLIALGLMIFFLIFGKYIMTLLSLDVVSVGIAGGIVLFLIAVQMIFPNRNSTFAENPGGEPFIVPLAVPLVSGPSTLTTILIFTMRDPGNWPMWLAVVVISWIINAVVLSFSPRLSGIFGERGLAAVEKLMGMILVTISVQMLLSGIKNFLAG